MPVPRPAAVHAGAGQGAADLEAETGGGPAAGGAAVGGEVHRSVVQNAINGRACRKSNILWHVLFYPQRQTNIHHIEVLVIQKPAHATWAELLQTLFQLTSLYFHFLSSNSFSYRTHIFLRFVYFLTCIEILNSILYNNLKLTGINWIY